MSKTGLVHAAWGLIAVFAAGCETLIGAEFEDYDIRTPGDDCVQTCPTDLSCNKELGICQCLPKSCEQAGQQCGGFIDVVCGVAVDCGPCPQGQDCTNAGNGQPNQCTPIVGAPCKPQTCAELGQTSGVHFSCGTLVDCNALPNCNGECSDEEVCTPTECCTPSPRPLGANGEVECGMLPDGCGRVVEVECVGGTCVDGKCCTPKCTEESVCGLNTSQCEGVYLDCDGKCEAGECRGSTRHFCDANCTERKCPDPKEANCGTNNPDGCGGFIQCYGKCPVPTDICTQELSCCTPRCPAKPEVCGANPSGCDDTTIQCPGPCPAGGTCQATGDGTFACSP